MHSSLRSDPKLTSSNVGGNLSISFEAAGLIPGGCFPNSVFQEANLLLEEQCTAQSVHM